MLTSPSYGAMVTRPKCNLSWRVARASGRSPIDTSSRQRRVDTEDQSQGPPLDGTLPRNMPVSRPVYGASAGHRVAVLAKSPLTPVRTPDDDVQLPFIDPGSQRDRPLGAELFGRVSGDHDNLPLHGLTEAPRFPQTTTVSWNE